MYYRLERIKKTLSDLFDAAKVQQIEIDNVKMKDGVFFTPEEADAGKNNWIDFDSNAMRWGGFDRHAWFRCNVKVPESFDNRALYLEIRTEKDGWDAINPQFLAFIDGKAAQGLDTNHMDIFVTHAAGANDEFTLDLQAYCGRVDTELEFRGFMVEYSPEVLKLYYDIKTPYEIIEKLDKDDIKRIELEKILTNTINSIDFREKHSKDFFASVKEAIKYLEKALYEDYTGFDEVIATCIGHTHIDIAWWWTVEQTREKVARSFSTVLKLMDEYPDYKFMSSQPLLYKFVKERYPELYERIKQRVKEGRWEAEGGMWVEADCNVTSGESLVRQFLHGKKFFKEEFGVDNKILWLPDVFGYSAALPQIMKLSGIKYFMTTKISWNQFNKLPYDTFWWKGIDGSEIFTHLITTKGPYQKKEKFFTTYNGQLHPGALMGGWDRYQHKDLNKDILVAFGYGDGGGGPTREMLEKSVRMSKGLPAAPKVRIEPSAKYFNELYDRVSGNPKLPRWAGELYLEFHRGTYTSMARNKKSNRRCELLYQDAEFFCVWAQQLGSRYPKEQLFEAWENILLNQFHDILPGSSIKEVYDQTKTEYQKLEDDAEKLIAEKIDVIANSVKIPDDSLMFLNSLSFNRNDVVEIDLKDEHNFDSLIDCDGEVVLCQPTHDKKLVAYVKDIPSKGYKTLALSNKKVTGNNNFKVSEKSIENDFYRIQWDNNGFFTEYFDKKTKRQLLKQGQRANVLRVFEDRPMDYDNWDIDIYHTEKSWIVDDVQSMEWIEQGPVRCILLTKRKFLHSVIEQRVIFYSSSPRVDFDTFVDWKQSQLLLKVEFPVDLNTNMATYDVQFGNVQRPTHNNTSWDIARFEVCGHKWADLSEDGFGVSLLNDCKYGYDIHEGVMKLTLLKSGVLPNPVTDQEEHRFKYSLYVHEGDWRQAETAFEAYKLNIPVYKRYVKGSGNASGTNAGYSLICTDSDNIVIETVKHCEYDNSAIVRLYEYKNRRSSVKLSFGRHLSEVSECDLMENEISQIDRDKDSVCFTIKPYEIKTFKVRFE